MTHRDNIEPEIINILNKIPNIQGKKILEIGQGMDTQFRNLFEKRHQLQYTATDSYIGSNNGGQRLEGREYHYNSMEDLYDFNEGEFDIIFSCHAFEHCENPLRALREMKRILKTGGIMILVTPWCCKHHIIDADPDHIFVLNPYQMMRLTHYAGFKATVIEQKNLAWKEQDYNIITIGEKVE